MTWWLKAAEEIRTLRQLGIAKPGSVISGFLLDVPSVTIEGEVRRVEPTPPEDGNAPALSLPAPLESAQPVLPVVQGVAPAKPPRSSFLRGEGWYKLRWEIRPKARKTASN